MPRIRRWFHVSHDINADGEVWELTDQFGVAGLRLWLELLSIADRNEGYIPAMSESTVRQLSIKCNTTQSRVRLVYDFTVTKTWVVSDPSPRIRNWALFNPSRGDKKEKQSSPPTIPSPSPPLPIQEEDQQTEPWRAVADEIFNSDKRRFQRLVVWIAESRKKGYGEKDIAQALTAFWSADRKSSVANWWPYLSKLIEKQVVRSNGHAAEIEGDSYKQEEAKWLRKQKSP